MPVEKVSRLRAKLEDLRSERQRLISEIRERTQQIKEMDQVIQRYLHLRVEGFKHERLSRKKK